MAFLSIFNRGVGPSANLMISTPEMQTLPNDMSGAQYQRPVEAMVASSREPSISRSFTQVTRERSMSIPRTITVIPSASTTVQKVDAPKKKAEPWTVDVTSYQFANVAAPSAAPLPSNLNLATPSQALAAPQPRQPPPTSPKPKFKAYTLPRGSSQSESCPVIPAWGAPPSNPNLQHVQNQGIVSPQVDHNDNLSKLPPMFKVAKVDAKLQRWQPTTMNNIAYNDPKHQFNESDSGMRNISQPSPQPSYNHQPNHQPIQPDHQYSEPDFAHQIPQAPPAPIFSPSSSRHFNADHIPGMVNPLICDDSHGDFGANPIVRPEKKMYSDSAFYDSPSMAYPTIQEQVAMAKEISNFLESNQNKRSRGGCMFTKRKQRAEEWTKNSQGQRKEIQPIAPFNSLSTGMPEFTMQRKEFGYSQVRHHPDPIKSKLSAAELEQIQHNQNYLCKHDSLPPNIAFDINQALSKSQGKAGQFFERRRQRAEKYVVDENSRRNWQKPPNTNLDVHIENVNVEGQVMNRSYKSPWEAAIEGRLDSAFGEQPQSSPMPSDGSLYQPLNVITNQAPVQPPTLNVKYNTFKPVRRGAVQSSSLGMTPGGGSSTLPRRKTRLEMMLEGDSEPSVSPGVNTLSTGITPGYKGQGLASNLQSPAPSGAVTSYMSPVSGYSSVAPPVQAVTPIPRPVPAQSSFTMSLKRPKDYMRQPSTSADLSHQPVSAF